MSPYRYVKAPPGHTIKKSATTAYKIRVVLSTFLIGIGVTALTSVVYPLVAYQLTVAPRLQRTDNLSPLPDTSLDVQRVRANEPTVLPEMINTALESITDLVTQEWRQEAKIAKDVAAGMMLTVAIGAVIVAALILLPKILIKV